MAQLKRSELAVRRLCQENKWERLQYVSYEWKGDEVGSYKSLLFSREPNWPSETHQVTLVCFSFCLHEENKL